MPALAIFNISAPYLLQNSSLEWLFRKTSPDAHNFIHKSIKIFFILISFFSCFLSIFLPAYLLSTSVLYLNKVDQFPNFQKWALFFFVCQNLVYDSGSLGYSTAFDIYCNNFNDKYYIAAKFPDVANLHFNSLG